MLLDLAACHCYGCGPAIPLHTFEGYHWRLEGQVTIDRLPWKLSDAYCYRYAPGKLSTRCKGLFAKTRAIQVAISRGGVEVAWTSTSTLVLLCLSAVVYVCFGLWEIYGATMPVLPLRLFTQATVVGTHLSTLTSLAANFIIIYYMPVSYYYVVKLLDIG